MKRDDPEQSARFKDLAEKLEAGGDPAAFMEKLRVIATSPRKPAPQPKKRKTGTS